MRLLWTEVEVVPRALSFGIMVRVSQAYLDAAYEEGIILGAYLQFENMRDIPEGNLLRVPFPRRFNEYDADGNPVWIPPFEEV